MRFTPGTRLDDFEIVGPVGSGGMGEVYRARDTVLKREVAIKVLPYSVVQDSERLRRFEQEAQATASLNHPNILAIYRFGAFEGTPYLVSELLDGITLRQLLDRGPLPARKAVEIGIQIATGLAAAHDKGIVHRDLKPENLFLTNDGRVKILDFGLAKLTQNSSATNTNNPTLTHVSDPGMVIGTVGYMSPEQVRGTTADLRADIFAFGAVLYEMLTGKRAFQRSTSADTMSAILNEDPSGILHMGEVPAPALQRVVRRCLEKNPEQRFQSASDLAFALDALSDSGINSGAAVPTTGQQTRRTIAWAAASVTLLATAVGAYFFLRPHESVPFLRYSIQRVIDNQHVLMTAISPDGAYLASVIRGANSDQDLWIHHVATGSERPILQHSGYDFRDLIFSPDGNFIYLRVQSMAASSPGQNDVYRIAVLGGQPARVLESVDAPLSFLDGGKRLCFYRQDNLKGTYQFLSAGADGGDQQVIGIGKRPFPNNPACSPDGRLAVFLNESQELKSVELASGTRRDVPSSGEYQLSEMKWAPDGRGLFAITLPNTQIQYLSYPGGNLRQITNDLSQYFGLSLTADSKTIASTIYSRNVKFAEFPLANPLQLTEQQTGTLEWFDYLENDKIVQSDNDLGPRSVDLKTNETTNLNTRNLRFLYNAAPCGAGTLVVSGQADSKAISVYKVHLDGSAPIKLTQGSGDSFPECTADGRWLFFVDNSVSSDPYLMRQPLQGGTAQRVMPCSVWYDLSPDGKSLANITYEAVSRLQIISTDSLKEIRSFPVPLDVNPGITFAADGKSIFYFTGTGANNIIWRQSLLRTAPAVKVVSLPGKLIAWMKPSPDGKKLGLALGTPRSEAVIIRATR